MPLGKRWGWLWELAEVGSVVVEVAVGSGGGGYGKWQKWKVAEMVVEGGEDGCGK